MWIEKAWLQTVGRYYTRCESEDHTGEKACKGLTLALKPRKDQKSKTRGISGPKNLNRKTLQKTRNSKETAENVIYNLQEDHDGFLEMRWRSFE